jgi:hypothetical protein
MQYPAGHLSHLSEDQSAKLDEFKKICQDAGYYTPATEGQQASHDDETMLYAQSTNLLSPLVGH